MWLMFVIIVLVAYVANLSSILTTRERDHKQHLPFTDVEDLVRNKKARLGAMEHGYVHSTMRNSLAYKYISDSEEWTQSVNEGMKLASITSISRSSSFILFLFYHLLYKCSI
ncbi:hypothetical protein ElyMa_000243400 [Elysia marginata]|uniref:Ionotropic glutamate receptor C-terminal domain-containing protein n=1 Tax=Elysia marginata TaxID=1093978 RepID=A0AAV4F0W8_9GAST|nr:hypothetical protein ElyMa_000243400 [Elysia marginata]